jgi:hypothetical protein
MSRIRYLLAANCSFRHIWHLPFGSLAMGWVTLELTSVAALGLTSRDVAASI